jgi:hypothetical protein
MSPFKSYVISMIIIKEHEIEWKYILVPSMLPIKFIKVYFQKIRKMKLKYKQKIFLK